jgi:hypothetical protein
MNGAGTADTGFAPNMGSGKPEYITEVMNEQQSWFNVMAKIHPVNLNPDLHIQQFWLEIYSAV